MIMPSYKAVSVTQLKTLKMRARTAAADPNCGAVALTEASAAFVSFQWQAPGVPPRQNVDLAPCSRNSAGQFSGNNAKSAKIVAFYAVSASTVIYNEYRDAL